MSFKYKPSEQKLIENTKNAISKLREMGREQIINRLKEIKEGTNYSSDLLAVILKTHRNILNISSFINRELKKLMLL